MPVSSSVDREQSHREAGRVITPLSREASDVMPTPAVRKTDVRTETQPNGSEVTTTIVEFTDQVNYAFFFGWHAVDKIRILAAAEFDNMKSFLFQDRGITGLSDVSYSTRQSVSPVSTETSPILTQLQHTPDCSPGFKPTYEDRKHAWLAGIK